MGIDLLTVAGKLAGFAERWPNLWASLIVAPEGIEYIDDLRFDSEPNSWSILLQGGVPGHRPKRTVAGERFAIGDRQGWLQFWIVTPPDPTGKDVDPTDDDVAAGHEAIDEFMQLAGELGTAEGLLTLPYTDSSGPAKRARLAGDPRHLAERWIGHVFAAENECETQSVHSYQSSKPLLVDSWRLGVSLGHSSLAAWDVLSAGRGKGAVLADATGANASAAYLEPEARVLGVLVQHPDWTNSKIADAAGVNRTSLYRMAKFLAARGTLKQGRDEMPRGSKVAGDVEAWDADS